jgi:hypothetical protein
MLDVTPALINGRHESFPMILWGPELGWTFSLLQRNLIVSRHSQTNSPAVKSIIRGEIGWKKSGGGLSGLFLCVFGVGIGGVEDSMAKLFNNGSR